MNKTRIILLATLSFLGGVWVFYNWPDNIKSNREIKSNVLLNKPNKTGWTRSVNTSLKYRWLPRERFTPVEAGLYEVNLFHNQEPLPAQLRTSSTLHKEAFRHAISQNWFDFESGERSGYVRLDADPLHYYNPEFAADSDILNPEKPEFLMYYPTDNGKILAGVMFVMPEANLDGPQVGGGSTLWHYHIWDYPQCLVNGIATVDKACTGGKLSLVSPQMLHVWFVDHPEGDFSSDMCLPKGVLDGWHGIISLERAYYEVLENLNLKD